MRCLRCQAENREGRRFCAECGAPLAAACPACGFANEAEEKFCGGCGLPLRSPLPAGAGFPSPQAYTPPHLAEKILTSRGALEGERKQVTVLFCDLANSTALAARLGPEAMHGLLNRFFELALGEVHRYEGTINQFLGDGFMALFGAPLAHEDHARRAVLAAVGIQRALKERRPDLGDQPGAALAVRIGLNTGLVVVGRIGDNLRMDYTAVGDTTHIAARLERLAEPGTILVSEATQRLVEAYAQSMFLGEREVKGTLAPLPVYRVDGLKPGAARFDVAVRRGLTPFVGRRDELGLLERRYGEAKQGSLRVVNVIGEAGIGKSRLVHELRQRLVGDRVPFLQGQCPSYGGSTPFLPFIEVVRALFGLGEGEGQAEVERKLRDGMDFLDLKAEAILPFLLGLLGLEVEGDALRGLDGAIVGARTREVLHDLLRARCRLSPVVLLVDDLHWADTASQELLLRLAQSEERIPLLVLCAYRPQYRAPWAGIPNVSELRLEPLPEESTVQLVRSRMGTESLVGGLVGLIAAKAEGNPLFAEELTRYLRESGGVLGAKGGTVPMADREAVLIPETLQDIIMARVDRLGEDDRTVLQVASVIGRRFPPDLVGVVSGAPGRVAGCLRNLEAQELVVCEDVEPREEYRFNHGLVRDAIYDSLLTGRREELHRRVAETIEQVHATRLGEWVEVLAHHYSHTPCAEKAVQYLARAGEKSLRVYSLEEADRRWRQVMELIESVPGCADDAFLADALLGWVRVVYYRKDFKGIVDLVERYIDRVEALGDARRLSLLLFWLGFSHTFGARYGRARAFLDRALALGESVGDAECIGYASMGLMYVYLVRPGDQPRDSVDRLGARGLEIAQRLRDVYLASKCLLCLTWHEGLRGRYEAARRVASRLQELGREAGDPRTMAMGLHALAFVNSYDERFEDAIANAEEALRISPDPLDRLTARGAKGVSLALMGRGREGLEILREVRRELVDGDVLYSLLGIDIPLGVAMVLAGEMRAGVRWIEEAIRRFSEWGNETAPAFGHLILGEMYLQMVLRERPVPTDILVRNLGFVLRTLPVAARKARRHLEEAMRMARAAAIPAVMARSLLNLGRLCETKRRWREARTHLDEAHRIAETLESPLLTERIRAAIASLNRLTAGVTQ